MTATEKPKPSLVERIRQAYRGRQQEAAESLWDLAIRAADDDLGEQEAIEALERLGKSADDLQAAVELHKQRQADREAVAAADRAREQADALEAEISKLAVETQQRWATAQAQLAEMRLRLAGLQTFERVGQDAANRLRTKAPSTPQTDEIQRQIIASRHRLAERDREILERLTAARAAEIRARHELQAQSAPERMPVAKAAHEKAAAELAAVEAERAKLRAAVDELDRRHRELDEQRAAL